ncbi:hypothetical protein LJR219_001375 [Phenylobacterium sp. LjRoot219]|uniref:hypothetical protein n=1 Tax=Phenylobacterium sp. LjRoot219 TaxID=3342283 RepID=UPI003ECCF2B8
MAEPDIQKRYNRDEDQKSGRPPRMAQEPKGSEGSARTSKTQTDPASGEPLPGAPAPNQAD